MRRILFDVDGVVADLVGALCLRVNAILPSVHLTPNDFTVPEFKDQGFCPDILKALEEVMCERGFVQTLPVHEEARQAIHKARDRGHEVVFVTKPYYKSETWAHDRQVWLYRLFPGLPTIHTWHKELIPGDILVEDNPHNLVQWTNTHHQAQGILICRPWNISARVPYPVVYLRNLVHWLH